MRMTALDAYNHISTSPNPNIDIQNDITVKSQNECVKHALQFWKKNN